MTTAMPDAVEAASDEPTYRILLIEDDEGDALLVEELLHDTGLRFELTTRTTLAEARAELTLTPIDCILLDLHLPDVSGIEAVAAVRILAPNTAVIVLTGLSEAQAGTDAMAAGAQDYLVKGKVEADLLHRTVRYAVYRSRTERASALAQVAQMRAEENARLERGLLPQPMLDTSTVKVTSRYLPGAAMALLGGDFLDVVEGDDGLLHAVVGDVSGHGPDAAALGVCLRIAWRSLVLGGHRGEDLLHLMERILIAERGSHHLFATCTLLTIDQDAATATLHLMRPPRAPPHHRGGHPGTDRRARHRTRHRPRTAQLALHRHPAPGRRSAHPLHRRPHRRAQRGIERTARRGRTAHADREPAAAWTRPATSTSSSRRPTS